MKTTVSILLSAVLCTVGIGCLSAQSLIETVEIPAGSFYMGSNGEGEDADEAPVHRVTISQSFRMGKTEVTNAQFEAFRPSHKSLRGKDGVSKEDDEAVVNVSYQDAVDFCKWLSEKEGKNYRLPTEAEWEYACRAGTYTKYYTGDYLPESMCRNQTIVRNYQPVSLKAGSGVPNAFGLYNMHGNVEEWCLDWYGPYSDEAQTDPTGPATGLYRVTRGGSHHTPTDYLRSANRMAMLPDDRHSLTGFRVVQSDIQFPVLPETCFFLDPIPFVVAPEIPDVPFYAHNHQPSVTWCDNGDLLAIWFSANQENGRGMVVLQSRLKAGEDHWSPATLFFKVPDRNMTGSSLFNDGHGTLYHFNGVEAAGDWQNLMVVMRMSKDNGYTWTAPKIIAPEHAKRHQVISGTIRTSKGWLVQACDAGPEGHDGAAVLVSKDGGRSWEDPWDGAPKPEFREGTVGTTVAGIHAGVVELKDGSWMALGRGNTIVTKNGSKRMPMSVSEDGGATWRYSASPFPPIDGGQRLVLMRLREGPILLVSFTDHPQRTPEDERGMVFKRKDGTEYRGYGMYAALSYDEGKTWPVRKLLSDGNERFLDGGAWTGFFVMDTSHAEPRGYLAGTQSPDGIIHIVSSRLHYRFDLKWLEQLP
ncbi:MAG TPA: SUMF1/EgtB/PvdO family nonheme iron enzyme [Candidatus Phocaeicola excrementigallinarum]|nr:SUMF1/EgtB/PvdO family nonheme iron enzyme [Candidatus Phocaeicola excrementigallinarum]